MGKPRSYNLRNKAVIHLKEKALKAETFTSISKVSHRWLLLKESITLFPPDIPPPSFSRFSKGRIPKKSILSTLEWILNFCSHEMLQQDILQNARTTIKSSNWQFLLPCLRNDVFRPAFFPIAKIYHQDGWTYRSFHMLKTMQDLSNWDTFILQWYALVCFLLKLHKPCTIICKHFTL